MNHMINTPDNEMHAKFKIDSYVNFGDRRRKITNKNFCGCGVSFVFGGVKYYYYENELRRELHAYANDNSHHPLTCHIVSKF